MSIIKQTSSDIFTQPCRLTLVFVVTNSLIELSKTLDSLISNSILRYNIIIFNNGSTDGTKEWLSSLEEHQLKFISSEVIQPLAEIYNYILGQIKWLKRDDVIIFPNAGVSFKKNWEESILKIVDADSIPLIISSELQVVEMQGDLSCCKAVDEELSISIPASQLTAFNGAAICAGQKFIAQLNDRFDIIAEYSLNLQKNGAICKLAKELIATQDSIETPYVASKVVEVAWNAAVTAKEQHKKNYLHSSHPLTIAVDARTLTYSSSVSRGIGHYSTSLLKTISKLNPQFRFKLYLEPTSPVEPLRESFSGNSFEFGYYGARTEPDADIYFILDPISVAMTYDSPFRYVQNLPVSAIFYDLIPLIYRQHHYDRWPESNKVVYNSRIDQMRAVNPQILAISENTRQDVIKHLHLPANRVHTIMAGLNQSDHSKAYSEVEIEQVIQKYGLKKPYLLTVGACDPHKNFTFVMRTIAALYQQCDPSQMTYMPMLAVVGSVKEDPYKSFYKEQVGQQGLKQIVFTDYVSREDLECLYAGATALLFPSEYEGFGFPVLEAMASHCAVITSARGAIPEVGGDCVLYIEPGDIQSLLAAIVKLVMEPEIRIDLINRGYERSRLFTWDAVAEKTVAAWQALLL